MILERIAIEHWRGVVRLDVALAEGVTLITGANEAGKSSLIEALAYLFRYPDDSGHRDIQAVRPVQVDAAPSVAVVATLGNIAIDYRKCYRKPGRSGRTTLEVRAPDGIRQYTGRDAHDTAARLLGEHLDRDLWQALQIEQGAGVEQAALSNRRGLQEALDAAAGTTAGLGSEDSSLIERIESEYASYYTPTGKARGPLGALPVEIAEREHELAAVEDRLAVVADTIAQHERLTRERKAQADQLPRLRQAAAAAADRLRDVERLEQQVDAARLTTRQAEHEHELARQAVTARATLADEVARLDASTVAGRERLEDLTRKRAASKTERESLGAEIRTLDADLRTADEALRQLQAARDRARLRGDRSQWQTRLAQLESVQRERDAQQGVVDGIRLQRDDVDELKRMHDALIRAEAAAGSASPDITLTALRALDLDIGGTPVSFAAGQRCTIPVERGFAMTVPELIEISVSTTDEVERRLADAAARRADFEAGLRACRAASLRDAEDQWQRKQAAQMAVKGAGARQADLLGDETVAGIRARLADIDAAAAGFDAELAGVDVPEDAAQLTQLIDARRVAREGLAAERERLEVRREPLQQRYNGFDVEWRHAKQQLEADTARREEAQARLVADRAEVPDAGLAQAVDEQVAVLAEARRVEERRQKAYRDANPEPVQVLADNAREALARAEAELRECDNATHRAEGQIASVREQGLFEQAATLASLLERKRDAYRRVERNARAAARLWEVVDRYRTAASKAYVEPLTERINALGRIVFGADFAVSVSTSLEIESRTLDGTTVPFRSLSIGAQEQIGILARLAAAQLVSAHGGVPLLLDDSLGYADDSRLQTMGAAIAKAGEQCQIIILTSMPSRFAHVGNATTVAI